MLGHPRIPRSPCASGPIKGTNNRIKALKRQAHGHRDAEFCRLRITVIHEAGYALAGCPLFCAAQEEGGCFSAKRSGNPKVRVGMFCVHFSCFQRRYRA
ncbi:transposase [Pseudodesulfovibrio senegalensis]|uniref:Transposase n=1 Tax=Pseudodesulfovibrio senegalensis TaxID=1721087 RepID=A0A6N6N4T5_9BACT|nr:transposase [Pseudodesulfovibrio senegalensis]